MAFSPLSTALDQRVEGGHHEFAIGFGRLMTALAVRLENGQNL